MVRALDDLVADDGDFALDELVDHFLGRDGQVLEAEQGGARGQELHLFRPEGADAADEVGAAVGLFGAVDDRGAGGGVVLVTEVGVLASVALDVDLVTVVDQARHGEGRQPDAVLVAQGFLRDTDSHGTLLGRSPFSGRRFAKGVLPTALAACGVAVVARGSPLTKPFELVKKAHQRRASLSVRRGRSHS